LFLPLQTNAEEIDLTVDEDVPTTPEAPKVLVVSFETVGGYSYADSSFFSTQKTCVICYDDTASFIDCTCCNQTICASCLAIKLVGNQKGWPTCLTGMNPKATSPLAPAVVVPAVELAASVREKEIVREKERLSNPTLQPLVPKVLFAAWVSDTSKELKCSTCSVVLPKSSLPFTTCNSSTCESMRCNECGDPYHYGTACVRIDEASSMLLDEISKACPYCSELIEKTSGCNTMFCARGCRKYFCWLCGLKLGPDGHVAHGHYGLDSAVDHVDVSRVSARRAVRRNRCSGLLFGTAEQYERKNGMPSYSRTVPAIEDAPELL